MVCFRVHGTNIGGKRRQAILLSNPIDGTDVDGVSQRLGQLVEGIEQTGGYYTRYRKGRDDGASPGIWTPIRADDDGVQDALQAGANRYLGLLGRRRGRFFRSASRLHVVLQLGFGKVD